MLPLVAKYGAAVVAITNDETGISEDPDVRFGIAEKIVHAAADHGIPAHDVVVDPLVMPIGAMGTAGRQVFALVRRLHDELGVNSTCGASNVSFGLPNRNGINGAFLAMAIANGLTSAITSPLHEEVRQATMAADVLMGTDKHSEAWIKAYSRPRRHRGDGPAPRRPRGRALGTAGASREHRRLHPLGPSRRGRRRCERARRGSRARGRPRLGLRRARDLRALPGRADGRARSRSTASRARPIT